MSIRSKNKQGDKSTPKGAEAVAATAANTSVTSATTINVPNGTSIWYSTGYTQTDPYGPATNGWMDNVSEIVSTKAYIHRRLLNGKKKRGDTTGANNSSNRLKILSPIVMYRFVKDRFRILERSRLATRLDKVAKLMENAKVLGQIAMADRISERFGKLIREQELLACGYTKYLPKKLVQQFIDLTTNKVIKLTPLKNYVRPIPKNVQKVLDDVQKKKLFDGYIIMHTDVNNTAVEKTREEKKDPILFGTLDDAPDILYFIADWIDEYCDLTFDQLIDTLDLTKEEYKIESDVEQSFLDTIL